MPWISLCTGREEEGLPAARHQRSQPAGRDRRATRPGNGRQDAQASSAMAQQPAECTGQQRDGTAAGRTHKPACDGAAAGRAHKPERDSRRRTQRPADDESAGRSSTVRIESHTHYRQNSMLSLRNCNLKIHLSGAMLPRYYAITLGTVHRPSFPTPNATPTRSGPPIFTYTPSPAAATVKAPAHRQSAAVPSHSPA